MLPARTGALRSLAYHCVAATSNGATYTATPDAPVGRHGKALGRLRGSTPGVPAIAQTRRHPALLLGGSAARLQFSCRGEPLMMSCRLNSVRQTFAGSTVDDRFIAYLRSLLRSTGPIPISKLASMIGDEHLERLGNVGGGLAQFIRWHPEAFIEVQLPGRVHVAMSNDAALPFRSNEDKTLGLRVIGLLTIAQHMAGTQMATSLGFSSATPTVTELCKALRHWSLVSPIQLKRFFHQYEEVFWYHPMSLYVRLRWAKPCTTPAPPARCLSPDHALARAQHSRLQLWLSAVLPSQYHVPLSYLMDAALMANMSATLFGCEAPSLEDVRHAFQQLPPQFVDVRAFGTSPMAIFVRLLRPEPLLLQAGVRSYTSDAPPPESAASHHDPTRLGRKLTEALQKGAAEDRLKHLGLVKGLHMVHLRNCVPADLVREIEVFYGLVEGGDLRVSVLLLDRLRHLWEVQLDSSRVRPWAFLPASEQPSSLTLETSPVPRVMVHLQRILADNGPQLPADLYAALPEDLKEALLRTYGPVEEADATPDTTTGADAVSSFVETHSLFFMRQGDHIYTPRLAAEELQQPARADATLSGARGGEEGAYVGRPLGPTSSPRGPAKPEVEMSEIEMAQFLHDAIPVGQPVAVDALRSALVREQRRRRLSGEKARRFVRREFFERHKRLFKLYEFFAYDKLIVGRAEDPSPPPHVLQPRMTNIGQVIKFIALLSSQSATDGALTRALPRDGRMLLKAVGSATDLAEQLPMWFLAQRDKHNFSSSLIRYIGPLAESEKPSTWALKPPPSGVLTRKVPNDPFADIGSENLDGKPAGWNDEWNEDEVDGDAKQAASDSPLT
ncbi:conserved hypothetical protein [Leishmania infantum JPCM5]|uniref:DUF7883 domain-containing protein n=1 Tax=Leishmania infantum TaxID=5671 RepID=A4HZQ6_LEIIN|nr:conserved hypothetical protein [Leishmania infantum JPCM5]CAM67970.2 conserved hypothetical protein [Leishmania infantum JPCM5]|eukprot:XP_001465547.2 conserved hypothetical protein [Leishmania infantum JPCM5]